MPEAAAALVLVAILLWVLGPLVLGDAGTDALNPHAPDQMPGAEAAAERQHVLRGLQDADLDLAMGKLTTEDHRAIHTELEKRAIDLMREEEEAVASDGKDARPS